MEMAETIPPTKDVILSMVQKHQPCTIRQIADYFCSDSYEIVKFLSRMARHRQILIEYINGQIFVSGNSKFMN